MTTRNLVPKANNEGGLGTTLKKWASGFIKVLTVDSINKLTITEPAAGSTLTINDGETVHFEKGLHVTTNAGTITFSASNKTLTISSDTTLSGNPFVPTDAIPSPGAYGETAPNTIRGLNKTIYKTADGSLTSADCCGTIVSNYGMGTANCTINLPTAIEGYSFVCFLPTVQSFFYKFRAGASDLIILDGTPGSVNGYVGVNSGYAAYDAISFMTIKGTDGAIKWMAMTGTGTWVAS